MRGLIQTRDVIEHASLIVHEFGLRCLLYCFWRTLTAGHAVTFLECVAATCPVTR